MVIAAMTLSTCMAFAQSREEGKQIIQQYLETNLENLKLRTADINSWTLSDYYTSKNDNITYAYIHQQVDGIRIFNAVSSAAIRDGKVLSFTAKFFSNARQLANTTQASLRPATAVIKAAEHLGLVLNNEPELVKEETSGHRYYFAGSGISRELIQVNLVFQPAGNILKLAWDVNIAVSGDVHWWNVRIDAQNGNFLQKNNWTLECDFGSHEQQDVIHHSHVAENSTMSGMNQNTSLLPSYRAFPFPTESPSHGPSVLLVNPSDPVASPYGWHDTDGNSGAEYTITRGNNVFAYDDIADNDAPGTSPDGTASLTFDFPYLFTQQPVNYLDASTTNLFYANNRIHDILYHAGFDENSGNFQENNYGNGGQGNDYVVAEAQDGGGTNNANFSTPPDGSNGRMQMYLWSGVNQLVLTVNSPGSIAGNYTCVAAGFGPTLPSPLTTDMAVLIDNSGNTNDACDAVVNGASLNGKIVLITRGSCNFVDKVLAAQAEGAVGVIMINNAAGNPFAMSDNGNGGSVTIPSVMVSQADGALLTSVINGGGTVNGTLNPPTTSNVNIDGSVDNGVVIHEYGHGVSNRLTGGPSNSNCLSNGEQGGEGWSDYFALLLTMKPGDVGTTGRGIGTYARGQLPSGAGIRRYRYSTDLNINPETYGLLAQSSAVHDIGEIWCSALWDMTWGLVDQLGFDPDWTNTNSGNYIALKLVLTGMKLQPCGPGFLDGRDAILQADMNLYGGAYRCIIWNAFARRGMGANAQQGSAGTAGDETEDFSLPSICLTPTSIPTANFSVDVTSTCHGVVNFSDLSTDIPQNWLWDFGDGTSSTFQNPQHTYSNTGSYTVTLIVSNTLGSDTLILSNLINVSFPPAPAVSGNLQICEGQSTVLSASPVSGHSIQWTDSTGTITLSTDPAFTTPALTNSTTYTLSQSTPVSPVNMGPPNNNFGAGGYHATTFEGRLIFNTNAPMRLISVWVDASGDGIRNIVLYSGNGAVVQSFPVFIPNGQSRVSLNLDIPITGNYQIGVAAGSNLYRNSSGASYPYSAGGLASITTSNSTTNPQAYYYYLYDWEVSELPCRSTPVPVTVNVEAAPISGFSYAAIGLGVNFTDFTTGSVASWSWDFGDGNTSVLQHPNHTYAAPGNYTVLLTVSSANGCQSTSSQTITVVLNGIANISSTPLNVYTENNQLNVSFTREVQSARIQIYDALGKELLDEVLSNGKLFRRDLSRIATGIIVVKVSENGKSDYRKVFLD